MKSSPYQHSLILGWCGSTRAYIQVGKVKPNANNTYSLMGAVFGAKWDYEGRGIAGMVAWKIGQNPLYSSTGQPVNTDGTTTQLHGWIVGSYNFSKELLGSIFPNDIVVNTI
jgi:hypothetical protein